MKTKEILIPLVVIAVLILTSCEPEEKISDIPEVSFVSLSEPFLMIDEDSIITHATELTFKFQDGNSDFGVDRSTHPRDSNLVVIPLQKINGVYDSIDAEAYGRKYNVGRNEMLEPDGGVKGEIKVVIKYLLKPPYDTLRFYFYIVDRAGNKSNVDSTTDIAF